MKPLAVKLAALGAVALGGVAALLLVDSGRPEDPGEHAALLEPLGRAYARDYGFEFTKVDTARAGTIAEADREAWRQKLGHALALGYAPGTKPFRAIPLEQLAEGAKVRMSRDRTPQQVLQERVLAGNTIVEATWKFGPAASIKSYTILGARGQVLFDTLLSLPVIQGPVFEATHF